MKKIILLIKKMTCLLMICLSLGSSVLGNLHGDSEMIQPLLIDEDTDHRG